MTQVAFMRPPAPEMSALMPLTPVARLRRMLRQMRALHERERTRFRAEIARIPGLMGLLMKPRNGARWNAEDRALLRSQLEGLGTIGLYLATLAIPGTTVTLPLLARWLDRRSQRRVAAAGS